jgi:hypothetical protein
MSVEELAGLVCETLANAGVTTTLTGGACVAIWSEGKYVSRDLDFIEEGPVPRRQVKEALAIIGFSEKNRYFIHPETEFYLEFPTGPLTVGDERVRKVETRDTGAGRDGYGPSFVLCPAARVLSLAGRRNLGNSNEPALPGTQAP